MWNSGAHYADWAILVARHDAGLPKHKGLVFFALDMKTPGVEARPIRQIPGTAEFNETFLERVRIPDCNRIGEIGGGWQVAVATLANERFGSFSMKPGFDDLLAAAHDFEVNGGRAIDRGDVRARLADWYVQSEGVRLTHLRALTALSRGRQVGPEASIGKVVAAAQCQDIASFGADLFEEAGVLTGSEPPPREDSSPTACSAHPACGSPPAPTRSCATSSPSACSACPGTFASIAIGRSRKCRPGRAEQGGHRIGACLASSC